MSYVRLRGLAQKSKGSNIGILSENTGYSFVLDGNDLVIPENDEQLKKGPPLVLKTESKPISLSRENHQQIAEIYIEKYMLSKLEKMEPLKEKIIVPGNFGVFGNIQANSHEFFFSSTPAETRKSLIEKVLPFMYDEMKAKAVFPLTCNVSYQQGMISIYRLVAGIDQFGAEHIASRIEENLNFMALVPTPASIATYPEALLMFSPFAVTFPFGKVASHLHFLHENLWHFPYLGTQGVFELLASSHNPVPVEYIKDFLNLDDLRSYGARKYFTECVNGINNLMRHLNDPSKFVTSNGDLDYLSALKAQSSIHMMFSDMIAINFTNNSNTKLRHAFAFFDKLANLAVAFHHVEKKEISKSEVVAFEGFFRPQFGKSLASMLKHHLKPVYEKLGMHMSKAVFSLYEKLEEGDKTGENLIRAIRNTQHGPYLSGNQFGKIFFSDYKIPYELVYLPILMMWGLMLDFENFLEMSLQKK